MAKWYLGSMNDALFIIDKPPMPAPDDTGPYEMPNGPKPISAAIDERNGELIVAAHNAAIATLTAALEEARGALDSARSELVFARIFVWTTQKIHPDGLALYDETKAKIDSALATINAALGRVGG